MRRIAALERLVGNGLLELEFLKGLCSTAAEKQAYIRDHLSHGLSVAEGCRLMGLSRTTFY
ncbi:hypothetical protein [Mesorhizobium hawassense]|uniref:hypothetical protein n=1 Tax=Mesorhizobium hawassense TaxID=1209954 RepID=UPI001ABEF9A4|nr:hypothetical protein [Mesorhizobium hawassense]